MQIFPHLYLQHGRTALHVASCAGHTEGVALLLDCHVDVHAVDRVSKDFLLYTGWYSGRFILSLCSICYTSICMSVVIIFSTAGP